MSSRRADRDLARACDRVDGELRRWDDGDFDRHPSHSAVVKFIHAVQRLSVHARSAMEDILRPRDTDPIEEAGAMDADRHEGTFRPEEISDEERHARTETLPPGLVSGVIGLHRAIQEKWKEIGRNKRRHWKTRCYVDCLSDAELTSEALLQGEPPDPGGARADLVH